MESQTKTCQNCKKDFLIESDDFAFYDKIKVPPPTRCPECRYQRRLANRNEWIFYQRNCDLCKKSIVSIHNQDYQGKVYCQPCFWSDKWEALDYGQEFDFSRPFFEQFNKLRLNTPRVAMANSQSVNSEYTNQSERNKNCYLCVSSGESEDCMYGYWNHTCKNCFDSYSVEKCEMCYELVNCTKCSRSAYLENCSDCVDNYFLKDCRACTSCFGCFGLRNKSYCWFNEQLTNEEYKKRLGEFIFAREVIINTRKKLREIELLYPHKYYNGKNTVKSTGNYLEEVKNATNLFNCRHAENIKYSQDAWFSKESWDVTEIYSELGYEDEGCICARTFFAAKTWDVFDSYYTDLCWNSNNLFGCLSFKKKSYCILNKQYTKEEYNKLVPEIIEYMKKTGEWGEFFPASISSFAYNETVAQDYFPLTKEEAFSQGYRWYERKNREYLSDIKSNELPQTIKEIDDSILEKTILCKTQLLEVDKEKYCNCTTAFKITKAELDFYRSMSLPLPEKCFHCRRQDRMALRNPRKLWHRKCMKLSCNNEFETSYAPDRPEIVYCESCYNNEVA